MFILFTIYILGLHHTSSYFYIPTSPHFFSLMLYFLDTPLKTFWNKLRIKHIYMHAGFFWVSKGRASDLLIRARGLRMWTAHRRRKDVPQKSSLTTQSSSRRGIDGKAMLTYICTDSYYLVICAKENALGNKKWWQEVWHRWPDLSTQPLASRALLNMSLPNFWKAQIKEVCSPDQRNRLSEAVFETINRKLRLSSVHFCPSSQDSSADGKFH